MPPATRLAETPVALAEYRVDAKAKANDYVQGPFRAFGIVLSEETSPLVSIGYRGLNPWRVQFVEVIKDGISITWIGSVAYPEAYYSQLCSRTERTMRSTAIPMADIQRRHRFGRRGGILRTCRIELLRLAGKTKRPPNPGPAPRIFVLEPAEA
jgi:hypothetical protein